MHRSYTEQWIVTQSNDRVYGVYTELEKVTSHLSIQYYGSTVTWNLRVGGHYEITVTGESETYTFYAFPCVLNQEMVPRVFVKMWKEQTKWEPAP